MAKLSELQLGTLNTKPFSFTRKKQDGTEVECKVLVRVLNGQELDGARINARRQVKSQDADMRDGRDYEELLEDARVREVLAIALRDPDDPEQPWTSPAEIRIKLSNIECGALWLVYEDWQNDVGPVMSRISDDQFEGFLKAVAEAGDFDPLLCFAPGLRRSFVRSMALELLSLRTANALLSSGSNDSSQSSQSEQDINEHLDARAELVAELKALVLAELRGAAGATAPDDVVPYTEPDEGT